jgi:hypothetical protein
VSTIEKLLDELRDALPLSREFRLADIEKTYGSGFARVLRQKLDAEEKKR